MDTQVDVFEQTLAHLLSLDPPRIDSRAARALESTVSDLDVRAGSFVDSFTPQR